DALEPYFPDLSDFERGNIWDFLFPRRSSGADEAERDVETPCRQLEKYLSAAIDVCGRRIVLDALFAEDERGLEEYFENLQEFRRKAMEEQVARARSALRKILHQHKAADKLVLLLKIYEEEDEAYKELVTVATLFYQYLLQPFRDMRELAVLYKMEILKSMEFEDLGPKRIDALEKEAEDWRKRAKDAVNSIQDIAVNYFEETSRALAGMLKQMEEDRRRFGQASWATAAPRLEKLKFMLSKETLQHMRAKEMCLNRRKEEIKEQMESLANQQDAIVVVDELELQYYETQLELYDTKFEILKSEELLLVAQIDTLRRRMKELKEEVVYYDTCEDPEELQSIMEVGPLRDPSTPAVRTLNRQLQQLETKRGAICSRRAYLRNKKDQCVEAHEQKHRQAQENSARFIQHHGIQLKRERKREEEQRRKEWVDQEREKTLSRLRSFREHHNTKSTLGSMDEVLASLQRGEVQLRRVEMQAGVPGDARESILSAIRLGVKLRKVQPATAPLASQGSQVSDLERSIKAAMQRMKKVSSDSDDEDRGDTHSGEWDS
ncbi:WASP-associated protein with actin, membranes and microtubules-like, partial [Scleropages formosus]